MKNFISIFILLFLFVGCSNDNAFEGISTSSHKDALIEDAAIALDDQDYDQVIRILTEIYDTTSPDPDVSRLIGSAYMGKSGLDTLNLISFSHTISYGIDDFDTVAHTLSLYLVPEPEDSKDEAICNIEDLTILLISGEALYIDGHCVPDLMDYLDKAKRVFEILQRSNNDSLDDAIQLGIISAAHFVLFTGNTIALALNPLEPDAPGYKEGLVPVPINKKAYVTYRSTPANVNRQNWDTGIEPGIFAAEATQDSSLTPYQEDMVNVYNAVNAFYRSFTDENDVAEQLEYFLRDIIQLQTMDLSEEAIIATMTTSGIYSYIDVLSVE